MYGTENRHRDTFMLRQLHHYTMYVNIKKHICSAWENEERESTNKLKQKNKETWESG